MKKDWLYLRQRIWSRIQEGKWRGAELERRGDTQYCQVSYNMEMQLQWSKGSKGRMWMGTRLQYAHVIHIWINGVMINRELASADHWQLSCALDGQRMIIKNRPGIMKSCVKEILKLKNKNLSLPIQLWKQNELIFPRNGKNKWCHVTQYSIVTYPEILKYYYCGLDGFGPSQNLMLKLCTQCNSTGRCDLQKMTMVS